jgi:small RNA 2'-O-methyltransferase
VAGVPVPGASTANTSTGAADHLGASAEHVAGGPGLEPFGVAPEIAPGPDDERKGGDEMHRVPRRDRRLAAALKERAPETVRGQEPSSSELHEERLEAVLEVLREHGSSSVLDLGCGSGALLLRLAADPRFRRIVGVDASIQALGVAERALGAGMERVSLVHGSFLDPRPELAGFDAAVLVEALEHVEPEHLSRLEAVVFGGMRPERVVLTTPNREYNVRYGLAEGELRHADHRFEWDRGRFRAWADGVAARNGYGARVVDVGRADPLLGSPTQMAVFRRGGRG